MEDFDGIYRRYLMEVYRYLLKLSGNSDIAEELTQETFTIAFEKLESFENQGKILVWLCQIAKFEYYSWCRKNRVKMQQLDENIPSGEEIMLDKIIKLVLILKKQKRKTLGTAVAKAVHSDSKGITDRSAAF